MARRRGGAAAAVKVAVYIGDAAPESGGGYTFIQEILDQLRAHAGRTSHRFVIVTRSAAASAAGLEVLSLPTAASGPSLRARRKLARDVDALLGRPITPYLRPDPAIDRRLGEAGVDVVWHLQPATWLTMEIPFITIVWDLQHRLQPYWPEVTGAGGFHQRDNVYGPLLRRAALVIAGTEVGSQEIQRFYGVAPERVRILPHPTPAFALTAAAAGIGATRPAAAPVDPYLFYPAQFWPHKNHANLLEALRLLRARDGLPFSLALSGSDQGNETFVRETAARLGVANAVALLGFVSRDELAGYYRHAFALAYPTFFGPENLPTLEAFALGCPVVASDVAGAREQLGDAALLFDPRKPEEIAAAVRRLHDDPMLRAALVERGRARSRRFTGEDFVRGVLAWLDEFEPVRRCWPAG
jgi:glycosyltransferase involved in cell wall biosynthesis